MFLSWFSRYPLTALEASFNESSRSYNAMTRFLALLFDPSGDPVNHQKELFAQARMFCTSSPQFGHAFLMATLVQSTVAANGFPLPAEYGWDALVSTLEEVWQLSLRLSSPLLEQLKLSPKSFNKVRGSNSLARSTFCSSSSNSLSLPTVRGTVYYPDLGHARNLLF